jgi:Ca-activated chloride channel homolog
MSFVIILNIFFSLWSRFNQIADINKLEAEAESAYISKKYNISIEKYNELINSYHNTDERVRMNLAHSYYFFNDSINAEFHYNKLSKSHNAKLNSVSNHQLGIIAASHKEYQQALKYFHQALKADPDNEAARYNYELIKKKLEEKEKNSSPQKDQNKQNERTDQSEMIENDDSPGGGKGTMGNHNDEGRSGQSQQSTESNKGSQEKSKGEGEMDKTKDQPGQGDELKENNELKPDEKGKRERETLISQRLKLMNMTEDKARMILEAMKNSEIQYLQQIKKKGNPKYGKDKPDW